jgi:hypothetical protein
MNRPQLPALACLECSIYFQLKEHLYAKNGI